MQAAHYTYSIIIVSYNCLRQLKDCLTSLNSLSARGEIEIIVVDNASRDETPAFLQSFHAAMCILSPENLGFAKACNVGARQASGEYLIFLNPDTLVTEGFADNMRRYFENPSVGAVGPLSNYVAGAQKAQFHLADKTDQDWAKLLQVSRREELAKALTAKNSGRGLVVKLLIGFCLMMRKKLFDQIGEMDEDLFLGNDDLDLSWRLQIADYKLVIATDAFVYHEGQQSFVTEARSKTDALVQESTDALYRKLVKYYGGVKQVPPSLELWAMDWFKPSPNALQAITKPTNTAPERKEEMSTLTLKQKESTTQNDWVAVPSQAFDIYPASLRPHLQKANQVVFVGAPAALPTLRGRLQGFDLAGKSISLQDQDMVIFKITAEARVDFAMRLQNLRQELPNLKKMILILTGSEDNQNNRRIATDALWGSGYSIRVESEYSGLPGNDVNPDGWQIIAEPRKATYSLDKKVSIIILGFNQVAYTRKCIESICGFTRQNYELILIDNGSSDGTADFFHSVKDAKVIINAENLGVAKGWNQGLRQATGDYVLIFNNDTIVVPNWLENMVRLAESNSDIGMVGPRSNNISGPQKIESVPYASESASAEEIRRYAQRWEAEHDLQAIEFERLVGFCLLIRREVQMRIGFFDERYGKGNFEDDDYCLRMRYHGLRLLIAHDSFVHHYGSVSYRQSSVDWTALMQQNQEKFRRKWAQGAVAVNDTFVELGIEKSPDVQQHSVPEIVAAQEAYVKGDLPLARSLFLRAQGKNPSNPAVYNGLGVICFHAGQYADALSLFIKSLELNPKAMETAENALDAIAAGSQGDSRLRVQQALANRFPTNTVLEQKIASLPEVKGRWQDRVEKAIAEKSFSFAMDILEAQFKLGQVIECRHYFGIIAFTCGDTAQALQHFATAYASDPTLPDLLNNYFEACVQANKPQEAIRLLENAPMAVLTYELRIDLAQLQMDISDPQWTCKIFFAAREANQLSENAISQGDLETARKQLETILKINPANIRAHNHLGILRWYEGRLSEALDHYASALHLYPGYTDALLNAFETTMALGQSKEMLSLAKKVLANDPGQILAEKIIGHLNTQGDAVYKYKKFEELEENNRRMQEAENLLQKDDIQGALKNYLLAIDHQPENPQALNGLGIIAHLQKRYADAYTLFSAASTINPGDQDILLNLWQSAQVLHKENDALTMLRSSLQGHHDFNEIREIVSQYV